MKLLIHLLWIFLLCNPLVTARVKTVSLYFFLSPVINHRSCINRSNNDLLWNLRPWMGLLIWVWCLQVLTSLGQMQWCACSHPALLCAVYPLQNQTNVAGENGYFWPGDPELGMEGVRELLCSPGCYAIRADVWWSHSDCHYLLVLPAGRDEPGPSVRTMFFQCPLLCHDALENWDQTSYPYWVPGATRHAEMPFSTPFWFFSFPCVC